MNHLDFLDTNGLVDGMIPAGNVCPFIKECKLITPNCPDITNVRMKHGFSCGAARFHSMLKNMDMKKKGEK